MRSQNILARLVTGFSVTEYNPITGYYEARGSNAHAWAEVWVENIGWVTYEATPAYPIPKPSKSKNTSQSIEEYLSERSKNSKLTDPESVKTALLNISQEVFKQFNIVMKKTWRTIKTGLVWSGNMMLYYGWLFVLITIAVFSAYHYLRYYIISARTRKKLLNAKKLNANEQIKASYQSMQELFKLHQHPQEENWTIQQYQVHLSQHFPELSDEIKQISTTMNQQLYYKEIEQEKTSREILQQAERASKYKFKIPLPAEKQLFIIRDYFKALPRIFSSQSKQEKSENY